MKKKKPSHRYGIAEWFGRDMLTMSPEERQTCGKLALRQSEPGVPVEIPECPFLSTLIPGARCNKAGGVCSIRKFVKGDNATASPVSGDVIVTICPSRFLQPRMEEKNLFSWVSNKMLNIENPTVVKETPFLRKISDSKRSEEIAEDMEEEAEEEGKKAGRIDWIVLNPETSTFPDPQWSAVETQALYFSGGKMQPEFEAYASAPSPVLYPVGKRRPDYRSSGPKRLAPQLDVKVPVLRNWGKKVAVIVDRYFYENMNNLEDAYPRARNDKEHRDNAEVVWFVMDYDENMKLKPYTVRYTTLESSRHALNATEPLSKDAFTQSLKVVINSNSKANKVFKASE